MKTLVLLCLSVSVALALPVVHPGEEQKSVEEKQSPLLGDRLPVQGHVVVENPAPQAVHSFEKQDKVAPVEMKQSEDTAELQVEVKPEVKEDQEPKTEAEVTVEDQVQVKPQQEVLVEAEAKMDTELQAETEFKVDAEVKKEVSTEKEEDEVKPEVKEGEEFAAEEEVEQEPEAAAQVETKAMEPELQDEADFKVESEVKVEPAVQMELELEEEPEVQMAPGQVIEERHIDMEGKYEAVGELEPLDDDDDDSVRQSPVAEALAEEGEFKDGGLDEDTLMEIDPEMVEEPLQTEDVVPDAGDLDEEAALDMAGQQMSLSESYFPEEEAGMEMRSEKQDDLVEEEEYMMLLEEAMRQATRKKRSAAQFLEEQEMEEGPQTDVTTFMSAGQDDQEGRHCPGVLLEEKCYQFFKEPKKAADAEFFCQEHFPKGHLASITSEHSHRELMNLILRENGHYTRTWVGGIKYLDTKRFVWLDGSHWSYADWLSGEPNDTSGVENCLEVLALGNGKFNDFTCWEPQPFICSYTYQ